MNSSKKKLKVKKADFLSQCQMHTIFFFFFFGERRLNLSIEKGHLSQPEVHE